MPTAFRKITNIRQMWGATHWVVEELPQGLAIYVRTDGDPAKRAFFRDFRDVNHQNDLGIG